MVETLRLARPDANVARDVAEQQFERVADGLDHLRPHLRDEAARFAAELLDAHRRVRTTSGAALRGLRVTAQDDADILGIYVFLPTVAAASKP